MIDRRAGSSEAIGATELAAAMASAAAGAGQRSIGEGAEEPFQSVLRTPVYVQVADQIRDAILSKRLVAGQTLPTERELTARFGVSRTSIREALRVLETQGWLAGRTVVTDGPGLPREFGTLLREGAITLLDLVYFRSMLEREAVVKGVLVDGENEWGAARAALSRMAGARGSVADFIDAYDAFHLGLVEAGGNRIASLSMQATLSALAEHVAESFHLVILDRDQRTTLDALYQEHVEVLMALESLDAARACHLLDEHFGTFYARVMRSHD